MSNTIIELKHSQVSGNTPSSLANGEISINTYDGKIFYKNPSGSVETFNKYPGPSGLNGEIQFNDLGELGASANLSFDRDTNTLSTGELVLNKANIIVGNAVFQSVKSNSFYQFGDGTRQYTANAGLETAEAAFNQANAAFESSNSISSFAVISAPGQNNVVANSQSTRLNVEGGSGVLITTNNITKTITITTSAQATSLFVDGADFGTLVSEVVDINDLGSISDGASATINLGGLTISGIIAPSTFILPTYTVSTLPAANPAAQMVFVSDESGGPIIAFSDGTNWRRTTDRNVVT
jgi:hypothetical protein